MFQQWFVSFEIIGQKDKGVQKGSFVYENNNNLDPTPLLNHLIEAIAEMQGIDKQHVHISAFNKV